MFNWKVEEHEKENGSAFEFALEFDLKLDTALRVGVFAAIM